MLVGTLAINDGRGLFRDHVPGETVELPAGPTVEDFDVPVERRPKSTVRR